MRSSKNYLDFLMEAIIFVLAVSSISKSIMVSLKLPISYALIVLIALVFYFLFSIYMYNIFTTLIAIPSTIYLFILFANKRLSADWWQEVIEYFNWLIDLISGSTAHISATYTKWSAWSITGIVSIIFFLLLIKLDASILSIILSAIIIGIQWALGHSNITPYIWIYTISAICLISSSYRLDLNRRYSVPQVGIWQLSVLPIAILIILFSMSILPQDTQDLKWSYIEESFDELEDLWTERGKSKEPRTSFRLTQTGFQTSPGELGGPIEPREDLLLKVKAPKPLYLRGTVLNEYTNNRWVDSVQSMKYPLNSLFNRRAKDRISDLDESFWQDLSFLKRKGIISDLTIDIETVGIISSTLFAPNRTLSAQPHIKREFSPYINDKGEIFTEDNIDEISGYTLDIIHMNLANIELEDILTDYIDIIDFREYIIEERENYQKILDIQRDYTTVDNSVSDRVKKLAEEITRDISSPIGKALAIESYLIQNYEYTLTPPYTPPDRDFVDHFLFDLQEGYCTYFASSMAILGRAVGLPTRYIEGFSISPYSKKGMYYEVRNTNSHAWVEVYFAGIGWLTFDPTPPIYAGEPPKDTVEGFQPETWDGDRYQDDYMDHYEDDLPDDGMYIPSNIENGTLIVGKKLILYFIYIVLAMLLIFSLSIWIAHIIYSHRLNKMPVSYQIERFYLDILDLLELYSFPINTGETPYAYARRVDTWLINSAGTMQDIADLIIAIEFSNYKPTKEDLDFIKIFHESLQSDTKDVIGFYRFLIYRIIKISKAMASYS
ncbi:MAG: hypothetical protein GX974_07250 [Clostridiales bacterium]|nr:hypothetical protein [Clostridiales bacterium]